MDMDPIIRECKDKHTQGASPESLVEHLRFSGLTITQSIKVLSQVLGISLGESKNIISCHPVWNREVKSAEKLHEELARDIASLGKTDDQSDPAS